MLGDFLYTLTPRDAQSLTLEVRDFLGTKKTFPPGIVAQKQTTDIVIPDDHVGFVTAAGLLLQPAAGFTNTINFLSLTAERPGDLRALIANKHENSITPPAANTYWIGLAVPPNCILIAGDTINMFMAFTASSGFTIDVQAYIRVLLIPRGNIGV